MEQHTFANVIYPPGGIQEVCTDLLDLFNDKIHNQEILINTSVQLNCKPHIGTITTFMCTFALAQRIQEVQKRNVSILVDFLENAPCTKIETPIGKYGISFCDVYDIESQKPKSEVYVKYYFDLLDVLEYKTGINYTTRYYHEFQSDKKVRAAAFRTFENQEKLIPIISPTYRKFKARIKCPKCNYMDFDYCNTSMQRKSENTYLFKSMCFEHGEFHELFEIENDSYVMLDTALRDLIKSMHFIELSNDNIFPIMVDGGDWGGAWALRIHAEALMALGYSELVTRYFTPLILDWSSAKFSKSVYVKDKSTLDSVFFDYDKFYDHYGEKGIKLLWKEVMSWINSPSRFFRHYSIEYIKMVLRQEV